MPPRKASLLARHMQASSADASAEAPWWKDDLQVVGAAFARARNSPPVRRRLHKLLMAWVTEDEDFRRTISADLAALGNGRRGATANPLWQEHMLVDTISAFAEHFGSVDGACARIAGEDGTHDFPMFDGAFGRTTGSVRTRYYRAKKRISER